MTEKYQPRWLRDNLGLPAKKKSKEDKVLAKSNRDNFEFPTELKLLIWAVSRSRTTVHYDHVHFCMIHNAVVDKDHIFVCDALNVDLENRLDHYDKTLRETKLTLIDPEELKLIQKHYEILQRNIKKLEEREEYVKTKID